MFSSKIITSFIGILILFFSCQNYTKNAKVDFNQVLFSEIGGSDIQEIQWVQSSTEWEAIHFQLNRHRYPTPEQEQFDFNKKSMLVLNFGQRNSGGFSANVEDVQIKEDSVFIYLNKTYPSANSPATTVMTTPYILLTIPKTDTKPVELIVTQ